MVKIFKRCTFDGTVVTCSFDEAIGELIQFRPDMTRPQIVSTLKDGRTIETETSQYTGIPPAWWF